MNEFIIKHYLDILENGVSEIAKINALKQLEKNADALEAYLKKQQAQSKKANAATKKSTPSLTDAEKALLGIQ
ncbi:hypothetical protein K6U27_04605 [Vibrio fluvialis]|uniref:hypothetical protein n=1 Tax=Vibrio fluvialis TaxID=676 RepID=UPI001EEB3971|nr:hypothetical protein [Vibrio fluvialis]MCG6371977.1 hypothetical protein [Vibrio fluvialis]